MWPNMTPAKVVIDDLMSDRRVKVKGGSLVLNSPRLQRFKPVCLLTTTVFKDDCRPPAGFVVDRAQRLVSVPDGYDVHKAFHFRGNAHHPVMEATVTGNGGVAYRYRKVGSGYTEAGYWCVPKSEGACPGVYSNDRGEGAETGERYRSRASRNDCALALLTLRVAGDEPIPLGAILYATQSKVNGTALPEVCTTFGYRPATADADYDAILQGLEQCFDSHKRKCDELKTECKRARMDLARERAKNKRLTEELEGARKLAASQRKLLKQGLGGITAYVTAIRSRVSTILRAR